MPSIGNLYILFTCLSRKQSRASDYWTTVSLVKEKFSDHVDPISALISGF